MLQQNNHIAPIDLLERYKSLLLTINSTEDARRSDPAGLQRSQFFSLNPDMVMLRYEPDTKRLVVDAEWLRMEWFNDNTPIATSLFRNTQYVGLGTARLLKGTGHSSRTKRVHVFDLSIVDAIRSENLKARENFRKNTLRKNKGDVRLTAEAMTKYDNLQWAMGTPTTHPDDMKFMLEQAKDVLKRLDRHALGLKPIQRKKKERERLLVIDNRMDTDWARERLTLNRTYIGSRGGMPSLEKQEYYAPAEAVIGQIKETVNRNGSNHKKQLFIEVAVLKTEIAHNYRNDLRYTHSQSTYIKTREVDAHGIERIVPRTLYCAVFDLLKKC